MARTTEHKEGKATVKVIYRTSKTLTDGSHPFWLRITKDRKSKFIATGLTLHPKHWNDKYTSYRESIRKTYSEPFRTELINALANWEKKYTSTAASLSIADEEHDAKAVADKVASERLATRKFKLLGYFDELINQFNTTGNVGNRKVYRDVQNNLRRFVGENKDVPFEAVTVKFCNQWETKMRAEGLTEITLSVKFRTLRAVLNKAIANGYANATSYPFARNTAETHKFQIGKFNTKTQKRAINKTDIRKIEGYEPEPYIGSYATLRDTTQRLLLAKNLFLFSYYCGGINFVDMASLRWSNIGLDLQDKPRLTYIRQKTNGRFSLRLIPQALAILEQYKAEASSPNTYVFPILNTALHKTPTQIHNRCSKIMGQVNADLKTIGVAVGIITPLTTYVARHSFATALKHSGVATAVISEAMGHSDERTTQIYLSEFETDLVDAAFENL